MKNRWLLLTLTVSLLAFSVTAFGQNVNVTFQLNTATAIGVTDTASTLTVRGGLAPLTWDAESIQLTSLGGDYWSATVAFDTTGGATDLEYKFHHDPNDNWEDGGNHTYDLTLGETTLALWYFNDGTTVPYTVTDSIDVYIRVNMGSAEEETISFDHNVDFDVVAVRGAPAPLDWGANNVSLTLDPRSTDSLWYSGTISFNDTMAGKAAVYKHVWSADPNWEGNADRPFTIPSSDTTIQWTFWNNTEATGEPVVLLDGNILLTIDMASYIATGAFVPGSDILRALGQFQGFNNQDVDAEMILTSGTEYEVVAAWSSIATVGATHKFFIDIDSLAHPDWLDLGLRETLADGNPSVWGWELPVNTGGGDRLYDWAGGNIELPALGYNTIPPEGLIPEGTSIDVTLSVDMGSAITNVDAPFDPATDSVWVIAKEEFWVVTQGINFNNQTTPEKALSDTDGDGVYTVTFTLAGPLTYGMTYVYEYQTLVGSQSVQEAGGSFAFGRYRGRFIPGFNDGTWPAAYSMPVDTFRIDPSVIFVVEDNPVFGAPVGVDNDGVKPLSFALAQNYPNPFNPSTLISYTIPAISDVNITIYNLLGQQIFNQRTGDVQPGSYEFKWNGVDNSGKIMASGVYFYKLSAGSHSAVKKMVLLK